MVLVVLMFLKVLLWILYRVESGFNKGCVRLIGSRSEILDGCWWVLD